MHQGTHAAGTLGQEVSVSRIAALENDFKSPEKGACAPGVLYLTFLYFYFDAQMPLNSWDGVNDDSCHCIAPSEKLSSLG